MTTPRARLDGVPVAVRRLWSLLYRAVRRQAVGVDRANRRVDRLYGFATRLVAEHRRDLEAVGARLAALDERVTLLGETVDVLLDRVAALDPDDVRYRRPT